MGGRTEAVSPRVEQRMQVHILYLQKLEIKPGGVKMYEAFRKLQMFGCDCHN